VVRAFNPLQARVLAGENHRLPQWVLFLSGDEQAKPAVVQLIEDARFEPMDLGGIEDSRFQEPGSALWNTALESGDAKALAAPFRAGHAEPADRAVRETARSRTRRSGVLLGAPVPRGLPSGLSWRVISAKWDGIREAFHGFDPGKVAALQPADIARIEADARVIRNNAKIEATVANARELLAILNTYGSIRAYLASFPGARAAVGDLHRRFRFLGDTGVWRLLTSAAGDLG
jgi:3-methyladenine DNA glycosylase Tag